MAAGALIGYKLCQYFLVSNPTYKVGSMVILSLLGDKTVDFYRRTTSKEGSLSYEELQKILALDADIVPMIIEVIH